MDIKTFRNLRVIVAVFLAAVIGISAGAGVPVVPAAAVLAGMAIMYLSRKQVKDVMVDERIERVSEKAAKLVFNAYVVAAGIFSIIVISLGPGYEPLREAAYLMSYTVCALLLLYLAAYGYYQRNPNKT